MRGKVKFKMKAKTNVIKNQFTLLRKYLRYPFNAHLRAHRLGMLPIR
jgi:hypothetical protein